VPPDGSLGGEDVIDGTALTHVPGDNVPSIIIRVLGADEAAVLNRVAPNVFDNDVDARWTTEFFADPRHHLAVALDGHTVVGMASAVHYVHPDKPPELWVNEVGVAPTHQGRGIGRQLMQTLFDRGRELGCREAWVGTEHDNVAARRLYASVGGTEASAVIVTFRLSSSAQPRGTSTA
jgi:ribosomal protein S18 acetylase RimI-like enzyme